MDSDGTIKINRSLMGIVGLGLAIVSGIGGTYIARVVNDARQDQRLDVIEKQLAETRQMANENRDYRLKNEGDIRELKARMRALDHVADDDPPARKRHL